MGSLFNLILFFMEDQAIAWLFFCPFLKKVEKIL